MFEFKTEFHEIIFGLLLEQNSNFKSLTFKIKEKFDEEKSSACIIILNMFGCMFGCMFVIIYI